MHNSSRHVIRQATLRWLLVVAVLGAMLFAVGYGVDRPLIRTAFGGIAGQPLPPGGAVLYSRAQLRADRAARQAGDVRDAVRTPTGVDGYFIPPAEADIPAGPDGEAIRRGRDIFSRTGWYVKDHVGNQLACANCHLDTGRRANAAPMWAAYGAYPAYQATTGAVSTLEDRIAACFTYSMNAQASTAGKAPAPGSAVYRDLVSYIAWLANGAPAGETLAGAGYPRLKKPVGGYDLNRGLVVYQQNCAQCHGANGQGAHDDDGNTLFPPLWGAESYNWGAGMAQIDIAAAFIRTNMPRGRPGSLTEQQVWDVAAYIDSRERPRDPRQTGTVVAAARQHHAGEDSFYGKTVAGHLLGMGVAGGRAGPAG